ncbi:MAG TPA: cation acetate symporter, partial [Pirellulaceae bacterium]|nr:cation acetate symporter [Pirellulaceae bacterium]
LSAASFLGICGMIAFYGYDGFLYSIGYLAGWIVALFVIAAPIRRLGKYTFADCLDARFQSRGIKLAAGLSTLVVSLFYLIPQMVGAGALIRPLMGFPHWAGVIAVGAVVIVIVVTAGMVSTTWVQFIKGSLLVVFSLILTVAVLMRGLESRSGGNDGYVFQILGPMDRSLVEAPDRAVWLEQFALDVDTELLAVYQRHQLIPFRDPHGYLKVFRWSEQESGVWLREAQSVVTRTDGIVLANGKPVGRGKEDGQIRPAGHVQRLPGGAESSGPLGPLQFLRIFEQSEIVRWASVSLRHPDHSAAVIYYQVPTMGSELLQPGQSPTFAGIRSDRWQARVDFVSLMLALFCGTASLPHILIRYYTVRDESAARKSTIVGIGSIGFFYVLTMFMGLGAMTSGALDITDSNMSAPLLAKSISQWLFALITAIAFTTVLGTVSGLILASAGAVAHDLVAGSARLALTDYQQVRIAKLTSVVVGLIAIGLGILFARLNVNFLVGWAFSIAASANLPALVMLLFWRGTTRQGIIASVLVGMISSLAWILLSGDTFSKVYGLPAEQAWVPFSQPGICTIPLSFAILVGVSLWTGRRSQTTMAINDDR